MADENKENPWKVAHLGVEFTSAILVGVALGYLVDTWLMTMPWFMVLFVVLGMAAGLLNVVRAMNAMEAESKSKRKEEEGKHD